MPIRLPVVPSLLLFTLRFSLLLVPMLLSVPATLAAPIEPVVAIDTIGLERSKRDWLIRYLNLKEPPFPRPSGAQLAHYQKKLTTTEVFATATVSLRPAKSATTPAGQVHGHRLVIEVEEKWTTIPVVRGAYGGGTPMTAIGMYDTHGLGRLYTFGVEARRYGNAEPGWVTWFRAPRWRDGRYTLGVELWQQRRERELYHQRKLLGRYATSATKLRLLYEQPLLVSDERSFHKIGIDLWWWALGDESFTAAGGQKLTDPCAMFSATGIAPLSSRCDSSGSGTSSSSSGSSTAVNVALRWVYDDIVKDHFDVGGTRAISLWGLLKYQSELYNYLQGELFHYVNFHPGIVVALHGKGRLSQSTVYPSQMFLGGFDSVRGFKDGIAYSPKAGYVNLEYRRLAVKHPRIHLQGVLFGDAAAYERRGLGSGQGSGNSEGIGELYAVGLGLRVSYPKINRLILRFDVAKPLSHHQSEGKGIGISLGLNQFFQPHKPL